ncbi:MAG: Crp/Fnr family transcriptional regulator [Epsilonproteobacteria bacterium]|nr:Crp/Fnr family transcriptional regulator [Campylobacterota bacterium]
MKFFQKGQFAMDYDDILDYFYIVINGSIKVFTYSPEKDKEQTFYILQSKDMFDVLTVLDGQPHEVYTKALEHTEVLELPIDKVREWLMTNPAFNKAFFPYIAKRMREIEELATDLSLHDTSTRLMKLLLKNIDKTVKNIPLIHNLSHEDIASMIGSVRQVVNRQLQELKKEGIIDIKRKKIAVNDLNKLLLKINSK